uniref:Protein-L-isoaspartate O-methyltransferase n=1 Tax=Caenorhabditis japonica TaxID=281687 RepID=A0A8R1DET2_CAEJA
MGNSESRSNDSMIDQLVKQERIVMRNVERAFRLVDRAAFLPPDQKNTYSNLPIKLKSEEDGPFFPGALHMSATEVYVTVVQQLKFERDMSFLNIGSGTGYLSTIVGFLIGEYGINHGIEIYQNLIDYAEDHIDDWIHSPGSNSVSWARPQFEQCDIFNREFLEQNAQKYDRIYIGFVYPHTKIMSRVLRMLKIGGMLVAPNQDSLCRFVRRSEDEVTCETVQRMNFSTAIQLESESPLKTPCFEKIPSLCSLSRRVIHAEIRRATYDRKVRKKLSKTFLVKKRALNTQPPPLSSWPPSYDVIDNFQPEFAGAWIEDMFMERDEDDADQEVEEEDGAIDSLRLEEDEDEEYYSDDADDRFRAGMEILRRAVGRMNSEDSDLLPHEREMRAFEMAFHEMIGMDMDTDQGAEEEDEEEEEDYLGTDEEAEEEEENEEPDPLFINIVIASRLPDDLHINGDLSGDEDDNEPAHPKRKKRRYSLRSKEFCDWLTEPSSDEEELRHQTSGKRNNSEGKKEVQKKRAKSNENDELCEDNDEDEDEEDDEDELTQKSEIRNRTIQFADAEFQSLVATLPLPRKLKDYVQFLQHNVQDN